jgi:hypothetical protein
LGSEFGSPGFGFFEDLIVFFLVLVEIGNIEEGISVQADIDKRRLHARQNAADSTFINAADEADVGVAFEIHLDQTVVFQHGDLRLVRRRGNIHLL